MATLREVRNRISGVKKTQKITKAMKMVAAAKLRRAQKDVVAARPYAKKIKELLQHLVPQAEGVGSSFAVARPVSAVALLVVTSDRGFCGAFNSNLLKAAVNHLNTQYAGFNEQGKVDLYCVGRKGADFFSKRQFKVAEKYLGVTAHLVFSQAQSIARLLIEGYTDSKYDRIDIVYNEFKSVAQQRIMIEPFLPIPPMESESARPADYIYEPAKTAILEALIPRHLNFQVWRVLLESNAAEMGARMAAMENATENAREMIEFLQLQYNKARQAAITKELLEVVSGAEALREAG